MSHIRLIISSVTAILCIFNAWAILPSEAYFQNEELDTVRINSILVKAVLIRNPQERVTTIGKEFIGTPYVANTLDSEPERLTINIEGLDCTTFVENTLALAYTAGEGRSSWRDYVINLEKIRYRNGVMSDYASRLHYISDWIIDNTHRGIIKEYTTHMPINDWQIKTLDFMSSNRDKYSALKDSSQYSRVKSYEIGYRNHRFPYIKTGRLSNKAIIAALKDGDIIAITTKVPGLDVSHMGILIKKDGIPYLMHASSKEGAVVIDKQPLAEYLHRTGGTGIRVIRLEE